MSHQGLPAWVSGLFVIVLGAAGCGPSSDAPAPEPSASAGPKPATGRVVNIVATDVGFSPADVGVKPGETVTLRFTRTASSGCMSTVALPSLGLRHELPLNQPVDVTITAPASGAVTFECGMAMVQGRIVVGSESASSGSATAAAPASAVPHADHAPRHGGIVTMEGDLHVEIVVAPDGAVDLYLSDSIRQPIPPAESTGTITIDRGGAGKQVLPLVADGGRGSLAARAEPPEQTVEYTWNVTARGQKTSMTLAVPAGGTAKLAASSSTDGGADAAGGAPEVRRAFGSGQVALSLDRSGRARLRLLDGAGAPRSARDLAAKIRASGKETPFSYDAARDELHVDVGPVKGDHVDAVVTITAPGGKATPIRVSFHLESTHKGR
jgi:plastocyanin